MLLKGEKRKYIKGLRLETKKKDVEKEKEIEKFQH